MLKKERKEMFNNLCHQGNANQKYFQISSYILQLPLTIKMTAHVGENVKYGGHPLPVGVQICTVTKEISMGVSLEAENRSN